MSSAEAGSRAKADGGLWETVKVIVQALLIALVVRTVLFQPFNIPTGSLVPTLLVGDYLFTSKYSLGYSKYSLPGLPCYAWLPCYDYQKLLPAGRILASEPARGEIVVFKLPRDNQTDYIKRVVGLPGDRIQVREGRLYINDQICEREKIADFETADNWGRPVMVAHYIETLPNGVKHEIIERDGDRGGFDNTEVFTVPPGHFFMMGDNRDNSLDSRDQSGVGYVPFVNLIGRAEIIFFSIDENAQAWKIWEWPWTVRWGRIFNRIR